jgi:uncharacterized protein (DUF2249 family)
MGDIAFAIGSAYDEAVPIIQLYGDGWRIGAARAVDISIESVLDTTGVGAMPQHAHVHLSPDAIYPFDARGVAKRFRHAAIFGALDALNRGETMRFVNDHDPLPLLDQLVARYAEAVTIRYVQRDPGAIVIDFVKN